MLKEAPFHHFQICQIRFSLKLGVDHKKNYNSKLAGTTMYIQNLLGEVTVLRGTGVGSTFGTVSYSASLQENRFC